MQAAWINSIETQGEPGELINANRWVTQGLYLCRCVWWVVGGGTEGKNLSTKQLWISSIKWNLFHLAVKSLSNAYPLALVCFIHDNFPGRSLYLIWLLWLPNMCLPASGSPGTACSLCVLRLLQIPLSKQSSSPTPCWESPPATLSLPHLFQDPRFCHTPTEKILLNFTN